MTQKGRGLYGRTPTVIFDVTTNQKTVYKSQREAAQAIGSTQAAISYAMKNKNLLKNRFRISVQL